MEADGRAPGLDADYRRLLTGQSVSLIGSQVSLVALPLTAALTLGASPTAMGVLRALEFGPFLVLGLFVGVWVDRVRRRPLMIGADLGRALLLASVPLAALSGWLSLPYLFGVALLVGALTVIYEVGSRAYLPTLVPRAGLAAANGRLEVSRGVSAILGPGLAALLLGVLAPPLALIADALSFAVSAGAVASIRRPESRPDAEHRSVAAEMRDGLGLLLGNPILRALAVSGAILNFAVNVVLAVLVVFLAREAALSGPTIGVVFAAAGLGGVVGAVGVPLAQRRVGVGLAILGTVLVTGWSGLVMAAAVLVPGATIPLMLVGAALFGVGVSAWSVAAVSLRQAITPAHMQGRVGASYQFVSWGALPLGALVGGLVGEQLGLAAAVALGGACGLLGLLPLVLSPLPRLRVVPAAAS